MKLYFRSVCIKKSFIFIRVFFLNSFYKTCWKKLNSSKENCKTLSKFSLIHTEIIDGIILSELPLIFKSVTTTTKRSANDKTRKPSVEEIKQAFISQVLVSCLHHIIALHSKIYNRTRVYDSESIFFMLNSLPRFLFFLIG